MNRVDWLSTPILLALTLALGAGPALAASDEPPPPSFELGSEPEPGAASAPAKAKDAAADNDQTADSKGATIGSGAGKVDEKKVAESAEYEFKETPEEKAHRKHVESDPELAARGDTKPPPKKGRIPNEGLLDPEYYYMQAQAFVKDEDYQSALNYINKALEMNPNYWDAWFYKGFVYQVSGYEAAAARRYLQLLDRKPDMLQARVCLGMLYAKHKNWKLAENEYRKAIGVNYNYFAAHFNLANLMTETGKPEEAIKEYKLCLKLRPKDAQVHNNMGVLFQGKNYLEEAIDEFNQACRLDPSNAKFKGNLQAAKTLLAVKKKYPATM